ncbi:MAG: hypothetical protein GXP63_04150 [DPANN group archaeon]|nr:hypothetical protein [DPANN group archaeon]
MDRRKAEHIKWFMELWKEESGIMEGRGGIVERRRATREAKRPTDQSRRETIK